MKWYNGYNVQRLFLWKCKNIGGYDYKGFFPKRVLDLLQKTEKTEESQAIEKRIF